MLPTADQYIQTLENDPVGAPRLREYRLERDNNGALLPYSGNSVLVLPATLAGRKFALRFFHNIDRLCFQRYEAVCEYLRPRDLPWKVDSQYLDKTIRIGEQYYPVLRMDWTEGWLLHEYIGQIVHDRKRLSRLQENLVALSQSLEKNGIGHGDLNFHHVLLVPDSQDVSIRLLDYDALFIPEFSGQTSISAGSPGFQHPGRLSSHYSETVDRFSIWIMIAALEAFKIDPKLWTNAPEYGYRNHEHLLFTFRDLLSPQQSRVFIQLRSYRNEALNFYIDRLEAFCHSALPESIDPPRLFGQGPEKKGDIPAPAPRSMPAQPPPAEKLYEFEIRSVPSGKDVLVRGQKRGITPMRLKVAKTDFAHVRIAAPTEQVPVPLSDGKTLYEINLVKKAPPPATPAPEDEILEFCADHYSVEAGGLVTLQWEVRGTGALRIDPLGPVAERKGTRQISVRDTTQYTLTLGEKSRSLIIHIQSRKEAPATVPEAAKRKASNRMLILLGLVMILGLAGYLIAAQFVRSRQERPSASPQIIPQEAKAQPRFSEARVSAFLNDLYTAYNQRDLASILHHYADTVRSYYEAGSLSGDSLMHVLNSLFISPEEYSCVPDLNTLELEPGKTECTVTLLLRETLRPGKEDKAKQYNTRIRYRIDSSYHIVAEGKATP